LAELQVRMIPVVTGRITAKAGKSRIPVRADRAIGADLLPAAGFVRVVDHDAFAQAQQALA
jgi:hypothetical protein